MKKMLGMLMVVCALCMTMSMSVFAASMEGFPTQKQGSSTPRYTRAIQVMMMNYSTATKSQIVNSGGVDGDYGQGTAKAVELYQTARGVKPYDGICGKDTWTALSRTVITVRDSGSQVYYRFPLTNTVILSQIKSSQVWYCYVNGTTYTVG